MNASISPKEGNVVVVNSKQENQTQKNTIINRNEKINS